MKDQLIFDTTSMLDSDNVGAHLRAEDGSLITHTKAIKEGVKSYTIPASPNVDVGSNGFDFLTGGHDLETGQAVKMSTDGTFPAGFDDIQTYYVIRINEITIQLAGTLEDAYNGLALGVGDAGSGNHTIYEVDMEKVALDVSIVNGLNVEVDISATEGDSINSWTHDGSGNAISSANGVLSIGVNDGDGISISSTNGSGTSAGKTGLDVYQINDPAVANGAIATAALTVTTGSVLLGTDVGGAALADRKHLYIYNQHNKKIYIGVDGAVTTANGFPLSPGSYLHLRVGDAVAVAAISDDPAAPVRSMELS